MFSIEYKVLFEVRFLHDYYLQQETPGRGELTSFFALNRQQRAARLDALLRDHRYDMSKDLGLILGAAEEGLFKNQRMKLVRTATGFFVGIEVERLNLSNNEVRFKPAIVLPDDAQLTIGLEALNPLFGAITNLRLHRDEEKLYFFSNLGPHEGSSLSVPVEPLIPATSYRMGDLARIGGGIRQAIKDNNGNAIFWAPVEGGGLVHQGDRRLDPSTDWYVDWRSGLDPRSVRGPLGVLKISLRNGGNGFSPIDQQGLLTTQLDPNEIRAIHPVYELRWASRKTYWRYRKRDGFSAEEREEMINGAGLLPEAEGQVFVTKDPRPITRERPPTPWPGTTVRLPNAQPGAIKVEHGRILSDIEFNELNPIL